MRILLIEDEMKVAEAVAEGLRAEKYSVTVSNSGEDGFFLLGSQDFDLLILDIMLPGRDGLHILDALRRNGSSLPVLLLTAKDTVEDRVEGLNRGADDYLAKPFAFSELLARTRALLRRSGLKTDGLLACADLEMDCAARKIRRAGGEIPLTAKEFELLEYFLRRQGSVVSRGMLTRDVWRVVERATPIDNVIDVHIARLRGKMDEPYGRKLLHTVRGVGFVLEERPE